MRTGFIGKPTGTGRPASSDPARTGNRARPLQSARTRKGLPPMRW